jgi:hypothetical protein
LEGITFSYKQEEYVEELEGFRRVLRWKNEIQTHTFENCMASVIGMDKDRARIVMRRTDSGTSSFMKSDYTINIMMGFVVKNAHQPKEEQINNQKVWSIEFEIEPSKDRDLRNIFDVKVWVKAEEGKPIGESVIGELFDEIQQKKGKLPQDPHLFPCDIESDGKVTPVIYQPMEDAWKNFLREVHVSKNDTTYEVTLVFNDERLRANSIWDSFYRFVRRILYKRIKDVETFSIYSENNLTDYAFPKIYSGDFTMYHDDVHEDKTPQKRPIKYYYQDYNHPIVFINTSNHAMAPHDNNHDFWKWEYVPWSKKVPIVLGTKSRKEVEEGFELKF